VYTANSTPLKARAARNLQCHKKEVGVPELDGTRR
jgi:hypothetical protein